VGTPKLAFVDSGIAANLLGVDVRSLLRPGGPFGPLLEGFVLMELARQLTWSRQRVERFHYRTKDKTEVDGILENHQGNVVGIKIKASSTVAAGDFRGLRHLAERIGDDFIAGLVFYTGTQTLSFGPRLRAVPVSALWPFLYAERAVVFRVGSGGSLFALKGWRRVANLAICAITRVGGGCGGRRCC
jgi:uncharacterized protein